MESSSHESRSLFSHKASKAKQDSTGVSVQGSSTTQSTKPDSASILTSVSSKSAPDSTEEARSIEASSSTGAQAQNVQSGLWYIALQKLSSEEKAAIQQISLNFNPVHAALPWAGVRNFDPVHAALPWAGVRFLLQVRLDLPLT